MSFTTSSPTAVSLASLVALLFVCLYSSNHFPFLFQMLFCVSIWVSWPSNICQGYLVLSSHYIMYILLLILLVCYKFSCIISRFIIEYERYIWLLEKNFATGWPQIYRQHRCTGCCNFYEKVRSKRRYPFSGIIILLGTFIFRKVKSHLENSCFR